MVFRGFNFPALLVAALSLEIIENVFPHVSKVADVAERERVMLRPQFGRGQSDIDVRSI